MLFSEKERVDIIQTTLEVSVESNHEIGSKKVKKEKEI